MCARLTGTDITRETLTVKQRWVTNLGSFTGGKLTHSFRLPVQTCQRTAWKRLKNLQ